MKSIKDNISNTIVIQKSKFICKLFSLQNIEEVNTLICSVKEEFKGANHFCYAYICGEMKKCSDDGEPSGTAGIPILNVLEKKQLNYILCIVIRYFGGIKLGTGGLVRAYSSAVLEALTKSTIVDFVKGKELICSFPYCNEKQMQYLLKNAVIKRKCYQNNIVYFIEIADDLYQQIEHSITSLASVSIQKNIYIAVN